MFRRLSPLLAILCSVLVPPLASSQNPFAVEHLRDEYQGETLLLRGFYSDDRLRYDSTGTLAGHASAGDWTGDGLVLIQDFLFPHKRLVVNVQRVEVVVEHKEFHLHPVTQTAQNGTVTPVLVEIKVDLNEQSSVEQFDDAMGKIFLTSRDHLADLIPDYWKPCLPRGLADRGEACKFSHQVLDIPGVASATDGPADAMSEHAPNPARPIFYVGKGVSPPRTQSSPEPEFSEAARRTKYQGVVTLGLIVTEKGTPSDIHILSPLGAGLDAKAVHAVEKWKFEPAEKDGQPVAVQIAVEVDFHLY